MKNNDKNKIIRFRKNGFIVEFEKNNGHLWFYIFRKIGSFVVDLMIYIALLLVLIFVFKSSLLKSFIITYFFFFLYLIGIILLLKNRTLGMLFTGLVFGGFDGDEVTKGKLLNRAFMTSIYAVPFIGAILIIASFISMILNKGLTPIDLFSKTQIFNRIFHLDIVYIYKNIDEEK